MAAHRALQSSVRPGSPAAVDVDPRWEKLYKIGGYATGLFILLSLASFLVPMTGLPSGASQSRLSLPAASELLPWITGHRTIFIVDELLLLAPVFLTIVTFLALYAALRHVDRAWALIGAALAISSLIASLLAVTAAMGLVSLSDQLGLATSESERTVLYGAATALIVLYNVPTLSAVLWPAGVLAISIPMLKGVFPRWVGIVGLLAGLSGMVGEAAFPIVGPVFYIYGLLILVWMVAVTWRLFQLGNFGDPSPTIATQHG